MKGDFTRDTFDALRHFSRVLMQQGRVQLDADFNEQAAILWHYLRTLATDLIGPHGGPKGDNLGFEISFPEGNDGNFTIGKGRYYVDGILCENETENLKYLDQEYLRDLPNAEKTSRLPSQSKNYYAYLDVWEGHITHVQTDSIREVALGGPDTCSRAQVVWQVKLFEPTTSRDNQLPCQQAENWVKALPNLSKVALKARVRPAPGDANACSIPPESRYRGLENQLYRIEIHRGGKAGTSDAVTSLATFKWSRDNGSVVFPIVRQEGSVVTVESLGRDQRTSLQIGDWVEIMDDGRELRGEPGILAQVDAVDLVEMTVTLKQPSGGIWPAYNEEICNHPLLRRWDHRAIAGMAMSDGAILIRESNQPDDGWIEIEDGIEVQFQPPSNGNPDNVYRTGDYWLVPARVATGKIEWPCEPDDESPKALLPHGIEHHYAPLAVIRDRAVAGDCRCAFNLNLSCSLPQPEQ